jgi:hypothetical protein
MTVRAILPQAEEAQYRDDDDNETDNIDNVVHRKSPDDGEMPVRQGPNPSTRITVASKPGVVPFPSRLPP